MKKAQGISMSVIVIAAIALLVLVILSVIFIGRMGNWGNDVNNCENKGGMCAPDCGKDTALNYPTHYPSWHCADVNGQAMKCCIATS